MYNGKINVLILNRYRRFAIRKHSPTKRYTVLIFHLGPGSTLPARLETTGEGRIPPYVCL